MEAGKRPGRRRTLLLKVVIVLISYLVLEAGCWLMIATGLIDAKYPTFHFVFSNPEYPAPVADINPVWGVWHYPEHYETQNGCVLLNYDINSYGARDRERARRSADTGRVVVLGDSFLEGFGVSVQDRVSDLLEKRTGHEFLNFCCADFGTTQEYLVYKNLADSFDHATVLVGFLPFNDFENDDLSLLRPGDYRYRPYYVRRGDRFVLEYHQDSLSKSTFNRAHYKVYSNAPAQIFTRFLRAFTCWFNIVDYIKNSREQYHRRFNGAGKVFSYYYDYTEEQAQRLDYVLGLLRQAAGNRRILLCSIPVITDFQRHRTEEGTPPLTSRLRQICARWNIGFIDLLDRFPSGTDNRGYFLPCDQHWNLRGNRFVADQLAPYFPRGG